MDDVGPSVPSHLRRFVVEQDYSRYTAVDQAVWRFVLLQTHARLVRTAHPAYEQGLAATGISVDRIPRIVEMNEKLSRFGWGAVCVDGFIPPRAFQEFQACGILPIAGEMRTREHLVYTPAPDIIHEAAGHAPILPDPVYAAYLRRIGDLGRVAFTQPEEDRVYRAIYALSEAMENPPGGPGHLARIEAELGEAVVGASEASEAARLSRLYWWTAEYGLVGGVDDYKIYGAGLLSSLGESHSCHAPTVAKLPLDEGCLDVPYDITRPQPQLFVAPSFEALHETLDRVASTLAVEAGGGVALARAIRSRDLASVLFSSGTSAIGLLAQAGPGLVSPAWLAFDGPGALAWDGSVSSATPPLRWEEGFCVVVGRMASGAAVDCLDEADIRQLRDPSTERTTFELASGARVEGRLERTVRRADGRLMYAELSDVFLSLPGLPTRHVARYPLAAAGDVISAHAGSVDPAYHPSAEGAPASGPLARVPRSRARPSRERRLIALYELSERAHRAGRDGIDAEFRRVVDELDRDYPDEWLLRWNLLESLLKARDDGKVARGLRSALERLEVALDHRQPIASGLRYLTGVAA
jgi:phenylalanine-4-hydroxylase